ncbi:MAG: leucyl/phenylalanyl-tRNA--protein transferase [Gallionella sp.]|nr:leucyl/phenylalanyl-tRNA--protein transferase [Gallionella sp.]
MIPWLTGNAPFPPVESALRSPNGLLAAGGDLSAPRLLKAYRHGIFPWFNPGEPALWWSPDPRMVLIPGEFKISRSLAKVLRNAAYEVRCDTAFEQVMRNCAAPRCEQGGTWINEDMIAAYCALHEMGYAHSVEVWMPKKSFQLQIEGEARRRRANDMDSAMSTAMSERGSQRSIADELELELAGGLYGVCIGRMFYGESMFSHASNASKIALAHLAGQLERWQADHPTKGMIDCQMNTSHLASLGAREIPRSEFIARLQELINCEPVKRWQFDADLFT